MRTLIASLVVIALSCGAAVSQQQATADMKVVRDGDVASLLISRGGTVNSIDMLRLYADAKGAMALVDTRKHSFEFQVTVPAEGRKLNGMDLDLFVQDGLEQSKFAMYRNEMGVIHICPAIEVITYAESIAEEDLDMANPAVWGRVTMRLRQAEPNSVRGALQNVVSRNGGQVNPIPPGTLMIVDRVDRLRSMVKTVREIDNKEAQVVKTLEAPEGPNLESCVQSLRELFPPDTARPYIAPPRFTGVTGTRRIVALARQDQHTVIAEALAKLK